MLKETLLDDPDDEYNRSIIPQNRDPNWKPAEPGLITRAGKHIKATGALAQKIGSKVMDLIPKEKTKTKQDILEAKMERYVGRTTSRDGTENCSGAV